MLGCELPLVTRISRYENHAVRAPSRDRTSPPMVGPENTACPDAQLGRGNCDRVVPGR